MVGIWCMPWFEVAKIVSSHQFVRRIIWGDLFWCPRPRKCANNKFSSSIDRNIIFHSFEQQKKHSLVMMRPTKSDDKWKRLTREKLEYACVGFRCISKKKNNKTKTNVLQFYCCYSVYLEKLARIWCVLITFQLNGFFMVSFSFSNVRFW